MENTTHPHNSKHPRLFPGHGNRHLLTAFEFVHRSGKRPGEWKSNVTGITGHNTNGFHYRYKQMSYWPMVGYNLVNKYEFDADETKAKNKRLAREATYDAEEKEGMWIEDGEKKVSLVR